MWLPACAVLPLTDTHVEAAIWGIAAVQAEALRFAARLAVRVHAALAARWWTGSALHYRCRGCTVVAHAHSGFSERILVDCD